MSQPIPIIICGKSEVIGRTVVEGMKPEFEVILFCTSQESAIAHIPLAVKQSVPAEADLSTVGTNDFTRKPVAAVLGGEYGDAYFDTIKSSVEAHFPGGSGLQWLRHDAMIPSPPLGPGYGQHVMQRAKDVLARLNKEGKFGTGQTGEHLY
ncbi:uncharacterized protein F5Z01DRAFT_474149 [Emericellopsis atlantica]|uniref:Uncharacterized protein n=1 Tax=Emericellopsis atlantica TaxID=2614577 RepID=A0A9P7ZCL9_9HYPO|nr:uncharacterized protein F5Z01DRAFT_474149 [Emericellopsis atlantica]KAG9249619.1 hypothetical protein F5Z01DRAFT_474149 [Emericellopsis atlantica]